MQENGVSVTPTAAAPQQVLALLAAKADQVVPVAVLVEELWPSVPPRGARALLQGYVQELRALITTALRSGEPPEPGSSWLERRTADAVLVSLPGGYRLDTGGGTIDSSQFERATGAGYRAMEAGDLQRAARRLGEGLALWHGEAFAGVAAGPHLREEISRLEKSRLSALDQWVEAQLRLGRHFEMISDLSELVAQYRTHEPLHGQFMVALLRCGRRDEALEVYQRLSNGLKKESGVEPSARLRRLQRSILTLRDVARPRSRPTLPVRVPAASFLPAGSFV
nr:AfsR/SARP family transcriptional regulator [Streptomyces purpureus]